MEDLGIFASPYGRNVAAEIEGGDHSVVISVVENRAREISICKIDTQSNSSLEIFLLSDNHSYNEAIGTIKTICPDEILLHDGTKSGVLARRIELECRNDARIIYISRQYFDQDRGAEMLKKVLAGDVDGDLVAKYTVLSGAYCLMRYIENCSGSSIAPHSMRVVYGSATATRMSIDRRTAVNLELISNARSGNQKESLFGAIDNTKTVVGGRLLRSNILRPTTDLITINTRLDLVELFLSNNRVFAEVVALLQQFPDLDKMLSGLTTTPKQVTQKTARAGIDTLIYLKQALHTAPALAEALGDLSRGRNTRVEGRQGQGQGGGDSTPAVHPLVGAIEHNLRDPALCAMETSILQMVTESTSYSKSVHEMRHQECFALRAGIHGLLDVSRKTYLQTVEDLYKLAENYSLQYGAPIKVSHSTSRGYFLSVPAGLDPLPNVFTQAVLNKRTISCSTEEFDSLSNRATEAITQALTLTHELIQTLLAEVRDSIDCLFTLTDSVALLDMLTSFADLVALSPHPYTRPIVCNEGPIVIKSGRHPVVSTLPLQQLSSSFVANDLFLSPLDNVHIITGPNGAGKTVYIKQTALIVILAQIGCFVPAKHATVPVKDRILSRLGTSDDMEHNMSTFFTEMREISYVLSNLTDRSLVIIDELGRGTSTIDGLSIAFAIAEQLQGSPATTLFVTHYPQITTLASMYPNVKNVHMRTSLDTADSAAGSGGSNAQAAGGPMKYLHEVGAGPCDMKSGYGLLMAEQSGFPRSVLQDARQLRSVVRDQFPVLVSGGGSGRSGSSDSSGSGSGSSGSVAAVTSLLQHLLLLKTTMNTASTNSSNPGNGDTSAARQYLQSLRDRIPDRAAQDMLLWLQSHNSIIHHDTSTSRRSAINGSDAQDTDGNVRSETHEEIDSEEPPSKVLRTGGLP